MIPFIDLAAQQKKIRPEIDAAVSRVLDHGKYIMGPEVAQLEADLCAFSGSKHCISVSNGTDALVAALMALDVGPGDAIITTPFTFFATVEAIMFVGATPVFADIDLATFNICPEEIKRTIKETKDSGDLNLKGIMTVDLFGLCADYQSIQPIADENGLFILQDSAQAFAATTADGRKAPTHGLIGTTSFFPAKPLGCYGDGGAVFTDNDELADKLRSIRVHGKGSDKYDNVRVGQNCRLDSIQAAVLIEKLKLYGDELQKRQDVANQYSDIIDRIDCLVAPRLPVNHQSAWAQYTVLCEKRDEFIQFLKEKGVPSVVYYRTPLDKAKACQSFSHMHPNGFANSLRASQTCLSLPFSAWISDEHVQQVLSAVGEFADANKHVGT